MKLKNKILLLTIGMCVVGILSISIINYKLSIITLEEKVGESVQLEAIGIAKDIDKWMALQKDSLYEVIENLIINDNFEHDFVINYLKEASDRNEGNEYSVAISTGFFANASGWKPDSSFDPTSRDWYVNAIDSNGFYISEPYVDVVTKDMVITISKAFETIDKKKGVIASDITIDYLVDLISSKDVGEGSYVCLFDNKGNIVTHLNDAFTPQEGKYIHIDDILDGKLSTIVNAKKLNMENRRVKDYDGVDRLFFFDDVLESDWKVGVGVSAEYALDVIKTVKRYTRIAIVAVLVLSIILALLISDSISKPIISLSKDIERIANYDLSISDDSQVDKFSKRKDEIGTIASSFLVMRTNLIELIKNIAKSSEEVASSSEELTATSQQSSVAAEEVARAIQEMASGASDQARDTEQGAINTQILGEKIVQNQQDLEILNNVTRDVNMLKDEGIKSVSDLVEKTDISTRMARQVNATIVDTNASAKEIEEASAMIENISKQINLLSLNAGIEAARAGEKGKGFAVVAEEIRQLAEQSGEFTEEIGKTIKQLAEKTEYSVDIIEEMNQISKAQSESVYMTNGKFEGIASAIENMNEIIENINKSSHEMQLKKDKIVDIMQDLSAIAQESAAGSEEASASVEEQTAAMEEIANASEALAQLATTMQKNIARFTY